MKRFTYFFLTLCLILTAGVAVASEAPTALDEITSPEFTAIQSVDEVPELAVPQNRQWASGALCGTCSPSPSCSGRRTLDPCWEPMQGGGTCNDYLGVFCSDGSGWDCKCYQSGEWIP